MKNLIFNLLCMLFLGISTLIRYLRNPAINGPLWFIILYEFLVIIIIIRFIIKYKKRKKEENEEI